VDEEGATRISPCFARSQSNACDLRDSISDDARQITARLGCFGARVCLGKHASTPREITLFRGWERAKSVRITLFDARDHTLDPSNHTTNHAPSRVGKCTLPGARSTSPARLLPFSPPSLPPSLPPALGTALSLSRTALSKRAVDVGSGESFPPNQACSSRAHSAFRTVANPLHATIAGWRTPRRT
jgi:hypothetical protein